MPPNAPTLNNWSKRTMSARTVITQYQNTQLFAGDGSTTHVCETLKNVCFLRVNNISFRANYSKPLDSTCTPDADMCGATQPAKSVTSKMCVALQLSGPPTHPTMR